MSPMFDPIVLEHELEAVTYPAGERCAFDGRPGDWPECCATHGRPCCDVCRDVDGFYDHEAPR